MNKSRVERPSVVFPLLRHWRELPTKAQLSRFAATILAGFFLTLVRLPGANVNPGFAALGFTVMVLTCEVIYRLCGRPIPPLVRLSYLLAIGAYTLFSVPLVQAAEEALPQTGILQAMGTGAVEEISKFGGVLLIFAGGRLLSGPGVGVREPLEGIFTGVISGSVFSFLESVVYVSAEGPAAMLSRPLLTSPALHAAASGLWGYFFGLALLAPKSRWTMLGLGFVASAGMHTLWDALAFAHWGTALLPLGILNYALLGAAILKARKLSPARAHNFATSEARRTPLLQLPGRGISLQPGLELLLTEIPGLRARQGDGVVAKVLAQGLCNLSDQSWKVTTPQGSWTLPPGQAVAIRHGVSIDFGAARGRFIT